LPIHHRSYTILVTDGFLQ